MPKSSTSTSRPRAAKTTVLPTPLPSPKATAFTIVLSCLAGLAFSLVCLVVYFVLMRRRRRKGSFTLQELLPWGRKRPPKTLMISKPVLQETKGSLLDKLNQSRLQKAPITKPQMVQNTSRTRIPRKPKPAGRPKHERRPSQALLLPTTTSDTAYREVLGDEAHKHDQPADVPQAMSKPVAKSGIGLSLSRFYAMTDRKKSVAKEHFSTVSGPGPLIMESSVFPAVPEAFSGSSAGAKALPDESQQGQRHESTYPATPSDSSRTFSIASRAAPLPSRNDHFPEDMVPDTREDIVNLSLTAHRGMSGRP